jgi:alpha-mannosidase II
VVYNPFEQERHSVVSIRVNSATVKVLSDSGKPVEVQVSAVWNDMRTISQAAYEVRDGHRLL